MKTWKMHWDRQLYKALEHQYQMGLEALNENLPEIKVELVFRYSNKIYFLVVYMKKQRNMMFHYCPTFIIIIRVVCSFLCVWVISVEHVSVRNLFWIWMWFKTTKLIVYKKKLKLSLPSQIAKKNYICIIYGFICFLSPGIIKLWEMYTVCC